MPPQVSVYQPYRGRFAPSPTGDLHFGSLLAAVGSWLRARSRNGAWLVRIEDLDPPREIAGASARILDTLTAFGLDSDEPVRFQHARSAAYQQALAQLIEAGHAFPCHCSRRDLQLRGGHHGRCRPESGSKRAPAWRMLVPEGAIEFDDAIQGRQSQDLYTTVGDFVLRRADGLWAYQIAVVVDDADQGITEIVRGADLIDSTPRQILLQRALALPTPGYAHLPVVHGEDGQKLSKQTFATPVDRDDPVPALRHALAVLGIGRERLPSGGTCQQLLLAAVDAFDLARIPATPILRSATWQAMMNG